jgi:hypothetical protein
MREIKFRMWNEENKLITNSLDLCDIVLAATKQNPKLFHWDESVPVMQYTGLNDKNGEEIYEGDIISYISFDEKTYRQECPDLTSFHFWQETSDNKTVEVIGNIYENPELLT